MSMTDPENAGEPCLPGFGPEPVPAAEPVGVELPPQDPIEEVRPQPDAAEAGTEAAPATCPAQVDRFSRGRLVVYALLAACAGVAVVAAHKLIRPRTVVQVVEKEIQVEPDGIPLALLPETAEADVWEIVANMSGEINGTQVCFKRGIALADGNDYRVCLDFCRSGNDIYAKVDGNGCWVVKVSQNGQIQKAYRAQKGGKPLRTLFAK